MPSAATRLPRIRGPRFEPPAGCISDIMRLDLRRPRRLLGRGRALGAWDSSHQGDGSSTPVQGDRRVTVVPMGLERHRNRTVVEGRSDCVLDATLNARTPHKPIPPELLAFRSAVALERTLRVRRADAALADAPTSESSPRNQAQLAGPRGKTGEDIARASTMLVQYDCPVTCSHLEAEQRISNVRPICPQRFESRFES